MPPRAGRSRGRGRGRGRGQEPGPRGGQGEHASTSAQETETSDPAVPESHFEPELNTKPDLAATINASSALQDAQADVHVSQLGADLFVSASSAPKKPSMAPRGRGRRAKEERDRLEAINAAKRGEASESARSALNAVRARDQRGLYRGRGRGGFMGDRPSKEMPASGPFSAGTASADVGQRRPTRYSFGGGSGGSGAYGGGGKQSGYSESSSNVKTEPGASGPRGVNLPDDGSDSSDIDIVEGPRKDIAYISLISDDEEDRARLPPVRIQRTEHQKRQQPVSLEPSKQDADKMLDQVDRDEVRIKRRPSSPAGARKEKPRLKDVQMLGSERVWRGNWGGNDDDTKTTVTIKLEPVEDPPVIAPPAEAPAENESERQPSKISQASPQTRASPRKRKPRARREAMPELQTEEERQEYNRQMVDLDCLREELGSLNTTDYADKDSVTEIGAVDSRAERVYLLQFPPVLPDLSPVTVKQEVATDTAMPDLIPDNTAESAIKVEDDATTGTAHQRARSGLPKLATGRVGKLRVHASGRTTLDWGGTALEMGMGTTATFLQDVLVVRTFSPDEKADDKALGKKSERIVGEALGLGPVRGKFIVTPDWDKII